MSANVVTGWPAGMLQDDSRELSRWLASRPNAKAEARDAALSIAAERLYPGNAYLQEEWRRAVSVVRSTSRGWVIDRKVERQ